MVVLFSAVKDVGARSQLVSSALAFELMNKLYEQSFRMLVRPRT